MAIFEAYLKHHLILFQKCRVGILQKPRKLGTWYRCVCCFHPIY